MAQDIANTVEYYLKIHQDDLPQLGAIRHWDNLKTANDGNWIWIKGLHEAQVQSVTLKSIPFKQLYYAKGDKLFPLGSKLPESSIPTALWTPIDRSIPVTFPMTNHNYFGTSESISMPLLKSEVIRESSAQLLDLEIMSLYMEQMPAIRMQHLSWCILGNKQVLVMGTPLLSLPGKAFYALHDFLIPAGLKPEFPDLLPSLFKRIAIPDSYVLWNNDAMNLIPKRSFRPLSLSSFRLSVNP